MKKIAVLLLFPIAAGLLSAQPSAAPPSEPLSTGAKAMFVIAKSNILKSADKMPEENYAFKPTPDVRSYGQILGHVADAQYAFCSAVLGETNPAPGIEKSKTSKALSLIHI